jgi:hypothetical protein
VKKVTTYESGITGMEASPNQIYLMSVNIQRENPGMLVEPVGIHNRIQEKLDKHYGLLVYPHHMPTFEKFQEIFNRRAWTGSSLEKFNKRVEDRIKESKKENVVGKNRWKYRKEEDLNEKEEKGKRAEVRLESRESKEGSGRMSEDRGEGTSKGRYRSSLETGAGMV